MSRSGNDKSEAALYGVKLYVDRYGEAVMDMLKGGGVQVIQSSKCFKVLHTSFKGSLNDLLQQFPDLAKYPVRRYTWWRKIAGSLKDD